MCLYEYVNLSTNGFHHNMVLDFSRTNIMSATGLNYHIQKDILKASKYRIQKKIYRKANFFSNNSDLSTLHHIDLIEKSKHISYNMIKVCLLKTIPTLVHCVNRLNVVHIRAALDTQVLITLLITGTLNFVGENEL